MAAQTDVKTLSREDLYRQVWTTPMRLLAKEYGLSDVGLAKICKRHSIPRPSLGYWAKKQFGKKVTRPALPRVQNAELEQIRIYGSTDPQQLQAESLVDQYFDKEIGVLAEAEARGERPIKVSESLRSPHALVALTKQRIDARNQRMSHRSGDTASPLWDQKIPCLDISVGKESVNRALRILDALLKAFEARGYRQVPAHHGHDRGVYWEAHGQRFRISIKEPCKQKPHQLTAEEQDHVRRYGHSWAHKYDYVLSGKLRLELCHEFRYSPICTINDGKKRRIEDRLGRITLEILREVDQCRRDAEKARIEAEKRAVIERQRQLEEEERQRQEEIRRQELARVEELILLAEQWDRCQKVRAYIKAVRDLVTSHRGMILENSEIAHWLAWAEGVADSLEPSRYDQEQESVFFNAAPRKDWAEAPRERPRPR